MQIVRLIQTNLKSLKILRLDGFKVFDFWKAHLRNCCLLNNLYSIALKLFRNRDPEIDTLLLKNTGFPTTERSITMCYNGEKFTQLIKERNRKNIIFCKLNWLFLSRTWDNGYEYCLNSDLEAFVICDPIKPPVYKVQFCYFINLAPLSIRHNYLKLYPWLHYLWGTIILSYKRGSIIYEVQFYYLITLAPLSIRYNSIIFHPWLHYL